MKNSTCVILIPIYKEKIDFDEYKSIHNTINLYNNVYDVYFMCNDKLNTSLYKTLFDIDYKIFSSDLFYDSQSYSDLLINKDFYKGFLNYEYMLIAQHDAYIFNKISLEYFINKKYNYLGALCDYIYNIDASEIIKNNILYNAYYNNYTVKDLRNVILKKYNISDIGDIGTRLYMSGGLSLRKIDLTYYLLKKEQFWFWAEDVKICHLLDKYNLLDNILVKDIIKFSVENDKFFNFYKKNNISVYSVHGLCPSFYYHMY